MTNAPHTVAMVNEAECIGCTKCIDVCPVDAILGSKNQMHVVIADECIGCKLCLPPCPVDCIAMIPAVTAKPLPAQVKRRHQARKQRLAAREEAWLAALPSQEDKKEYVKAALRRARKLKT